MLMIGYLKHNLNDFIVVSDKKFFNRLWIDFCTYDLNLIEFNSILTKLVCKTRNVHTYKFMFRLYLIQFENLTMV